MKYTFTCTDEDETTTIKEFEAVGLSEIVSQFQDFLAGCGFAKYEFEIVQDDNTDVMQKDTE